MIIIRVGNEIDVRYERLEKREERKEKRETMRRHNYKNLKIRKIALEISKDISDLLNNFPSSEKFNLVSQMSRCSISISSNIAEGSARTDTSFSYFLNVAIGSSFELPTQLLIAQHKKYINEEELLSIEEKIIEFQKMTMSFQNKLKVG